MAGVFYLYKFDSHTQQEQANPSIYRKKQGPNLVYVCEREKKNVKVVTIKTNEKSKKKK